MHGCIDMQIERSDTGKWLGRRRKCRVLSVAVCCSLLQFVAVIGIQGSVTQRWACFLLQSVAVCCSLLQSVAESSEYKALWRKVEPSFCCSLLQSVAVIGIQGSLTQRWAFFRKNIPLALMYHILFSFTKNMCITFFLTCIISFFLSRKHTTVALKSESKKPQSHDAPDPWFPNPHLATTQIKMQHCLFDFCRFSNFFWPCWKEDTMQLQWDL